MQQTWKIQHMKSNLLMLRNKIIYLIVLLIPPKAWVEILVLEEKIFFLQLISQGGPGKRQLINSVSDIFYNLWNVVGQNVDINIDLMTIMSLIIIWIQVQNITQRYVFSPSFFFDKLYWPGSKHFNDRTHFLVLYCHCCHYEDN